MRNRLRVLGAGFTKGAKSVVVGAYRHDCLGLAAQIAYSALFSIFPFLLFLRSLMAYFPFSERLGNRLLDGLAELISTDSRLYQIVADNIFAEVNASSVSLLSVGVILTVWSASGAVMALIKAVNRAYGLTETRSWQRRRLTAVGLAVAGAVLIPAGLLLVVFGSWVGRLIGQEFGGGSVLHGLWIGLRWPVLLILLVLALGVFYHFAPNARQPWYSVIPGAVFAVGAMIGASLLLSWFLSQSVFQVQGLTYGVIGTVMVLVFWAFLIGLMALIGGEINAVVGGKNDISMVERNALVESSDDK